MARRHSGNQKANRKKRGKKNKRQRRKERERQNQIETEANLQNNSNLNFSDNIQRTPSEKKDSENISQKTTLVKESPKNKLKIKKKNLEKEFNQNKKSKILKKSNDSDIELKTPKIFGNNSQLTKIKKVDLSESGSLPIELKTSQSSPSNLIFNKPKKPNIFLDSKQKSESEKSPKRNKNKKPKVKTSNQKKEFLKIEFEEESETEDQISVNLLPSDFINQNMNKTQIRAQEFKNFQNFVLHYKSLIFDEKISSQLNQSSKSFNDSQDNFSFYSSNRKLSHHFSNGNESLFQNHNGKIANDKTLNLSQPKLSFNNSIGQWGNNSNLSHCFWQNNPHHNFLEKGNFVQRKLSSHEFSSAHLLNFPPRKASLAVELELIKESEKEIIENEDIIIIEKNKPQKIKIGNATQNQIQTEKLIVMERNQNRKGVENLSQNLNSLRLSQTTHKTQMSNKQLHIELSKDLLQVYQKLSIKWSKKEIAFWNQILEQQMIQLKSRSPNQFKKLFQTTLKVLEQIFPKTSAKISQVLRPFIRLVNLFPDFYIFELLLIKIQKIYHYAPKPAIKHLKKTIKSEFKIKKKNKKLKQRLFALTTSMHDTGSKAKKNLTLLKEISTKSMKLGLAELTDRYPIMVYAGPKTQFFSELTNKWKKAIKKKRKRKNRIFNHNLKIKNRKKSLKIQLEQDGIKILKSKIQIKNKSLKRDSLETENSIQNLKKPKNIFKSIQKDDETPKKSSLLLKSSQKEKSPEITVICQNPVRITSGKKSNIELILSNSSSEEKKIKKKKHKRNPNTNKKIIFLENNEQEPNTPKKDSGIIILPKNQQKSKQKIVLLEEKNEESTFESEVNQSLENITIYHSLTQEKSALQNYFSERKHKISKKNDLRPTNQNIFFRRNLHDSVDFDKMGKKGIQNLEIISQNQIEKLSKVKEDSKLNTKICLPKRLRKPKISKNPLQKRSSMASVSVCSIPNQSKVSRHDRYKNRLNQKSILARETFQLKRIKGFRPSIHSRPNILQVLESQKSVFSPIKSKAVNFDSENLTLVKIFSKNNTVQQNE